MFLAYAQPNTVFAMCVASLGLLIIGSLQKRKPRQTTGLLLLNSNYCLTKLLILSNDSFINAKSPDKT